MSILAKDEYMHAPVVVNKGQRRTPILSRFMRYVDCSEGDQGCWAWLGGRSITGLPYGKFSLHGRTISAHRAAWIIFRSQPAKGLCVLHHCDTPWCVNPAHLFLGTYADNTRDMITKHRDERCRASRRGEHSNWAKLRPEQVIEIRLASGRQREIAAAYGISQTAVSGIKLRKVWAHI